MTMVGVIFPLYDNGGSNISLVIFFGMQYVTTNSYLVACILFKGASRVVFFVEQTVNHHFPILYVFSSCSKGQDQMLSSWLSHNNKVLYQTFSVYA